MVLLASYNMLTFAVTVPLNKIQGSVPLRYDKNPIKTFGFLTTCNTIDIKMSLKIK